MSCWPVPRHLAGDRGLAVTTIGRYERFAWRFLAGRAPRTGGETGAEGLAAAEVGGYLLEAASRLGTVDSVKREAADLRALLRFLYLDGVTGTDLVSAMPPVAGWRGTRLPADDGPAGGELLLDACDRIAAAWRRDLAILALLARLGLRCGEVAACSSPTSTGAPGRSWCAARPAPGPASAAGRGW